MSEKSLACELCGNFHDPAYSDCATGEPIEVQAPSAADALTKITGALSEYHYRDLLNEIEIVRRVIDSAAERSEQEWDKLMQQARAYAHCNCPDAPGYHSNCQRHLAPILDKLDAALAADRQTKDNYKREAMELARLLDIEKERREQAEHERDGLKDANRGLFIESNERYEQLLSALAALEKIKQIQSKTGIRISALDYDAISQTIKFVDLSLPHQHDAEVRKPLVDLLLEIRDLMPDWTMKDLKDRIDAALAQCKTKPI